MKRVFANPWNRRVSSLLKEMSGAEGRLGGEAPISSMGTTSPPMVEEPIFLLDKIIPDGAQVTRPSIDPYREPIETHVYLFGGSLRLSIPLIIGCVEVPERLAPSIVSACYRLGVLVDWRLEGIPDEVINKFSYMVLSWKNPRLRGLGKGIASIHIDRVSLDICGVIKELRALNVHVIARVPSLTAGEFYRELASHKLDGLLIDEDLDGGEDLELAVSIADEELKKASIDGIPARWRMSILASSSRIRGSADIYKLMGLGADAVELIDAWKIAVELSSYQEPAELEERMENFILAIQKELRLLAGAAGVSSLQSSLVGNRELFRSIEMDGKVQAMLGVKRAGL